MSKQLLLALLLLSAPLVWAAEPAAVIRPTELRAEPFTDAEVRARLEAESRLSVLGRKGGWYEVESSEHGRGWVRMTAVRKGEGSGGDTGLGSALQFLTTGRSGSSGVTAATGIRGLDSADVVNAEPDPKAVDRLEQYAADAKDARRFAAAAKLEGSELAYLGKPGEADKDADPQSDFPEGF